MKHIKQQDVLDAIKDSGSIISTIARRLHCNWNTAKAYCNKWESTKNALQEEKETTLDTAELKIIDAIKAGDTNIIKWFLSTKGKERGYTTDLKTTLQLEREGDDPIINIVLSGDEMTKDELQNSEGVEISGI